MQVPIDPRESLRHNISLDDEGRLEHVVMNWIESQCSPVTWQNILDVLSSMSLKNTASKVKEFLKEQQVIDKYMSKPPITHYIDFRPLLLTHDEYALWSVITIKINYS